MKYHKLLIIALCATIMPLAMASSNEQIPHPKLSGLYTLGGELYIKNGGLFLMDGYTSKDGFIQRGEFKQMTTFSPLPATYHIRHLNPKNTSFSVVRVQIPFNSENEALAFAKQKAIELQKQIPTTLYENGDAGNYYSKYYYISNYQKTVTIGLHYFVDHLLEYDAVLKRHKLPLKVGNISVANDTITTVKKKLSKQKGCKYSINEFPGQTLIHTKGVCFGFEDEVQGTIGFKDKKISHVFVDIKNPKIWQSEFVEELKRKYKNYARKNFPWFEMEFYPLNKEDYWHTASTNHHEFVYKVIGPDNNSKFMRLVCDTSSALPHELRNIANEETLERLERERKAKLMPNKSLQGKL